MAFEDLKRHLSKGTVTVLAAAQMAKVAQANAAEIQVQDAKHYNVENTIAAAPKDSLEGNHISFDDALASINDAKSNIQEDETELAVQPVAESPENNEEQIEASQDSVKHKYEDVDLYGIPAQKATDGRSGESIYFINDTPVLEGMLDAKKMKKYFKEDQKYLFKNAEPDRIHQDTTKIDSEGRPLNSSENYRGVYNIDDKNIKIPYFDTAPWFKEKAEELEGLMKGASMGLPLEQKEAYEKAFSEEILKLGEEAVTLNKKVDQNDINNVAFKSIYAHEDQHRENDKSGIYAPGLSAEEYAVLNQYDEISANVAECNLLTRFYQKNKKDLDNALKNYPKQVAELNKCYSEYKKALESGISQEDAMKIFDNKFDDKDVLKAYKDELIKGDKPPDNKEYAMKSFDKLIDDKSDLAEYKGKLLNGEMPDNKEYALKVFDRNDDFLFYKEAIANGLDPDSKEGKKQMVEGTYDMWVSEYQGAYSEQINNMGTEAVNVSSFGALTVGNQQEFNKRVNKIFDNIKGGCKEFNIKGPGKLSEFLPNKAPDLSDEIAINIASAVREKIGMSREEREQVEKNIGAKNDKHAQRELIKRLTGRGKSNKNNKPAKQTTLTNEQVISNSISNVNS